MSDRFPSGNRPSVRDSDSSCPCPFESDILAVRHSVEEIKRRLLLIDGNGIDKEGGAIGRLFKRQDKYEKDMATAKALAFTTLIAVLVQIVIKLLHI